MAGLVFKVVVRHREVKQARIFQPEGSFSLVFGSSLKTWKQTHSSLQFWPRNILEEHWKVLVLYLMYKKNENKQIAMLKKKH